MNWTSAALGATVAISLLLFIWLRKDFLGPGAETLLPESDTVYKGVDADLESKGFDDKDS